MNSLKEEVKNLTGGEILFIFEPNPQDRHEYTTYVVSSIDNTMLVLETPKGQVVSIPVSKLPYYKVLVLENSPLVEKSPSGWRFA